MTKERIDFLNKKYAIASLFVDIVYSPLYDVLGKVFGAKMKAAAEEIRRFNRFDGHATVMGVDIGYEHLDVSYRPKKTGVPGYTVKVHPDRHSFSAFPKGLYD